MTSTTTQTQQNIIIEWMEKYPFLAKNSQNNAQGRDKATKRWEQLCKKLNENGPPIKNTIGWKKTWADYKHRAKTKLSKNKLSLKKTGGGPFKEVKLSQFESRVVEVAAIEAAVTGIHLAKEFGLEVGAARRNSKDTSLSPREKTPVPSTSEGFYADENDGVEHLLRDLLSDDDDSMHEHEFENREDIVSELPTNKCELQPNSSNIPIDKLTVFKQSAEETQNYHQQVLSVLTEIKNVKIEELQLRKQFHKELLDVKKQKAKDFVEIEKRKLSIREQELKIALSANELKQMELNLRD